MLTMNVPSAIRVRVCCVSVCVCVCLCVCERERETCVCVCVCVCVCNAFMKHIKKKSVLISNLGLPFLFGFLIPSFDRQNQSTRSCVRLRKSCSRVLGECPI